MPGIALWFTGLSGSGKTSLCHALEPQLRALGHRVCVLDADELRSTVNRDLGFSKAERDENVARLAILASDSVQRGWVVLVAAISPYRAARARARSIVGSFLEIYVDAPLEVCIRRDPKGLYARALGGQLRHFTGIDDPYEAPVSPDLHVNTDVDSLSACTAMVLTAVGKAMRSVHAGRTDTALQ